MRDEGVWRRERGVGRRECVGDEWGGGSGEGQAVGRREWGGGSVEGVWRRERGVGRREARKYALESV